MNAIGWEILNLQILDACDRAKREGSELVLDAQLRTAARFDMLRARRIREPLARLAAIRALTFPLLLRGPRVWP